MKITKLIIKNFQQFQEFELDLTYPIGHPKEGQALDKVCFIGRNGTGKSTLLNLINHKLTSKFEGWNDVDNQLIIDFDSLPKNTIRIKNTNSLITFCPSEGEQNLYKQISDVPSTNVNEALELFNNFPFHHTISTDTINDFWKLLIFLLKKRENDFLEFQNKEENLDKTIRQIKEEFDTNHPTILDAIAKLWNKILDKAGLEFDVHSANNPIQLTDNLKAYIKVKATGKKIEYHQLSTGIRNFIFKIGHIFSLYFNRPIEHGFLLVDEPENSLFPDFLYDLVEIYFDLTKNTQLFMATHSPIIAAQFEPCERIILDFDENGKVFYHKGITPTGDDPNDLLVKDFGIESLLGKEGIKKWERYIELKLLIQGTNDWETKKKLMAEYMEIGTTYNFSQHEIPTKNS